MTMRKQINITKGLENPRFCGKFLSIFKVLRFENCFMVLDFNVQKKTQISRPMKSILYFHVTSE